MIKTPQIFDIVKIYIQWFSLYCTIWQGITLASKYVHTWHVIIFHTWSHVPRILTIIEINFMVEWV